MWLIRLNILNGSEELQWFLFVCFFKSFEVKGGGGEGGERKGRRKLIHVINNLAIQKVLRDRHVTSFLTTSWSTKL